MTSQISNAPGIGFTQAGGFQGVTVRNPAAWYGLAGGAVSSATSTSVPNSVAELEWHADCAASQSEQRGHESELGRRCRTVNSSNYFATGPATYTFNPIKTATPTTSANNHPNLILNGYVGGVMLTAWRRRARHELHEAICRHQSHRNPRRRRHLICPAIQARCSPIFKVTASGVSHAPTGGMTIRFLCIRRFGGPASRAGLNTARGAYVDPSNFAARAAAIFNDGANTPLSRRATACRCRRLEATPISRW